MDHSTKTPENTDTNVQNTDTKEPNQSLGLMVRVKTILESVYIENCDPDFQNIVKLVSKYVETKCNHHIVFDWIDTTPDDSKMIRYCIHCNKTFV